MHDELQETNNPSLREKIIKKYKNYLVTSYQKADVKGAEGKISTSLIEQINNVSKQLFGNNTSDPIKNIPHPSRNKEGFYY